MLFVIRFTGKTDSREIRELFQTGPLWIHGMRESVEILHWPKAFTDGHSLV